MGKKIGRAVGRPQVESVQMDTGPRGRSFEEQYPRLQAFLERERGAGIGPKTGCLTLFYEDGKYKICLNDRPNNQSLFVASETLSEAFRIGDRQLGTGRAKWHKRGYKAPTQPLLNICAD